MGGRGEGEGGGLKVCDGLGKVLNGLKKARAFQRHITLKDIISPLSCMPPYWAPYRGLGE